VFASVGVLLTTICTRRQEQGFVMLGALRGVFGFGSLAKSALVKWSVRRLVGNIHKQGIGQKRVME